MLAAFRLSRVVVVFGTVLALSLGCVMPLWAQADPAATDAVAAVLDRRFNYQADLSDNNGPVNGVCDFRVRLFDAESGGSQVGTQQVIANVTVSDGDVSLTLNAADQFGDNAFTGQRRWLELAVRCPAGSGDFATLTPRQALDATPFALYAAAIPLAGSGSANDAARSDHDHFGQGWSGSNATAGLSVTNNASTGTPAALLGIATDPVGFGVLGTNTSTSGAAVGVFGNADSDTGRGVFGYAPAATGATYGVYGQSNSSTGTGVEGYVGSATGVTFGVRGESNSNQGRGVSGAATATGGQNYGVFGISASTGGRGVYGEVTATSGATYGVQGVTRSADILSAGVYGFASSPTGLTTGVYGGSASPNGLAVAGYSTATTGPATGVYGRSDADAGAGVEGLAAAMNGVTFGVRGQSNSNAGRGVSGAATATSGENYGVYGISASTGGTGVFGFGSSTSGTATGVSGRSSSTSGRGVFGFATATTGNTYGVSALVASTAGTGVYGEAYAGTGTTFGVMGLSFSTSGTGVYGKTTKTSGSTTGVYGESASSSGRGVFGVVTSTSGTPSAIYGFAPPNGFAGAFDGNLTTTGTKNFRIDHPLDPANKTLNHAAVESSEIMNLYTGNAVLDGNGEATVTLPDWFGALNTSFRYQLTPIGAPGPNLYIAAPIENNVFRIGGGTPGMNVSWLVTGVRHDPTSQVYPLVVEQEKPEGERGTYLTPAAYNQPPEMGTSYRIIQQISQADAAREESLRLQREGAPTD